ncbi:MAG: hypothetical protein ACOYNY_46440 [Caldilineaceae bacterium]|jgi:hypothetical protein
MIIQPILAQSVAEEQYKQRLAEAAHHRQLKSLPAEGTQRQPGKMLFFLLLILVSTLFFSAGQVISAMPTSHLWSPGVVSWSLVERSE